MRAARRRSGVLDFATLVFLMLSIFAWLISEQVVLIELVTSTTTTTTTTTATSVKTTTVTSTVSSSQTTTTSRSTSSTKSAATSSTTTGEPPFITTNGELNPWPAQYPANYSVFAAYAVSLINQDRANGSGELLPVILSSFPSAQQHAESQFIDDYTSHYDPQGYNPVVRFSAMNGTGAVEENNFAIFTNGDSFVNITTVESAIKLAEHDFVYNDSSSDYGHRLNILDPYHNQVAIGIYYDSNRLYFVQDFINSYVNPWSVPVMSHGYNVTLDLTTNAAGTGRNLSNNFGISVYFYPDDGGLSPQQLASTPYNDSYSYGTYLGGVIGGCPNCASNYFTPAITVFASSWSVTGTSMAVTFSLAPFLQSGQLGIYTVVVNGMSMPVAQVALFPSLYAPSG